MSSGSSGSRGPPRSPTPTPTQTSEALEEPMPGPNRPRQDRDRSRSPLNENPRDLVVLSETSRSDSSSSELSSSHAENPRPGTSRQRTGRNGTPRPRISHILIKHRDSRRPMDYKDKPVTRTKNQALQMMIDIHKKISSDLITFADAAFSFSECTSARHQGDIQKHFRAGRIQESFEGVAMSLKPGQISEVIESNSGYHILQRRE